MCATSFCSLCTRVYIRTLYYCHTTAVSDWKNIYADAHKPLPKELYQTREDHRRCTPQASTTQVYQ